MTRRGLSTLVVSLLACATTTAFGQERTESFQRRLDQLRQDNLRLLPRSAPPEQRVFFDYGVFLVFDYLSLDESNGNNATLRQYDSLWYTRLELDNAHELFLRGRLTYRDFSEGDELDPDGSGLVDPDLDVGYYRFDLAGYLGASRGEEPDGNITVQLGRDYVLWGNGLVLAERIDGGVVNFRVGDFSVDLLAGITPVRTVDFDSSRPAYFYNTRRGFYGLQVGWQRESHRLYAYGLLQQDYNAKDELQLGAITTRFHYDSYYVGVGAAGAVADRWLYAVEGVVQGGRTLSNSFTFDGPFLTPIEQQFDDILAFAIDARLDYLFADVNRSRLSFQLLVASGDDDRLHTSNTFGGNAPGTNDRAFNAFGAINTGFSFAPAVSNLLMLRAGASTFPFSNSRTFRDLQVGADLFFYGKFDPDAPIDETTADQRYLGWEPDLFINWRITSDVTLAVRYGVFFPSAGAFPGYDARQYVSTSLIFGL